MTILKDSGFYDWYNPPPVYMDNDKERRKTEYQDYKDFQRKGYERDTDPCKNLKNKIDYHKELNKRRKNWDSNWLHPKYPGGRHKDDILNDTEKIKRWERELRDMCGHSCNDTGPRFG